MDFFIEEVEIEGVVFSYRGLTVMEMASVLMDSKSRTRIQIMPSFWVKVAMMAIVDWYGVTSDTGVNVPFNKKLVGELPEHVLETIGKLAYLGQSMLSDEEDSKLRGYVRFANYLSQQPDSVQKSYSCRECIKSNRFTSRKCGFTEEERAMISQEETPDEDAQTPKEVKLTKNKMIRKTGKSKVDSTEVKNTLNINDFKFPECPISWVDDYIKTIGDQVLFCHNAKITYFSGGVGNQLNKIYSMVKVVGGELSEIEYERHKSETNKNSPKQTTPRGRR